MKFITLAICAVCLTLPFVAKAGGFYDNLLNEQSGTSSANNHTSDSVISGDGRYVALRVSGSSDDSAESFPGPGNFGVIAFDRRERTSTPVSVGNDGVALSECEFPSISDDGRYIAFSCDTRNENFDGSIYIRDQLTGSTELIVGQNTTPYHARVAAPIISGNGKHIVYGVYAENIESDQLVNQLVVYRYTLDTDSTVLISHLPDGTPGFGSSPDINYDGDRVVFRSQYPLTDDDNDDNLPTSRQFDAYLKRVSASGLVLVSVDNNDFSSSEGILFEGIMNPAISGDGNTISMIAATITPGNGRRTGIYKWRVDSNEYTYLDMPVNDIGENVGFVVPERGPVMDHTGCTTVFGVTLVEYVDEQNIYYSRLFAHDCVTDLTSRISFNSDNMDLNPTARVSATSLSSNGRSVVYDYRNPTELDDEFISAVYDFGDECDVLASGLQQIVPFNNWVTLSLPCIPPLGSDTVQDVFGDDAIGTINVNWVVFTFDPETGTYTRGTLDTVLAAGQGLWFFQNSDVEGNVVIDLPVGSNRVAPLAVSEVCGSQACRTVDLGVAGDLSQWSLLGTPDTTAVAYADIRLLDVSGPCAGNGCPLADAGDQMFGTLYYFDPTLVPANYRPITIGDVISPWEGFWIASISSNSVEIPQLYYSD